MENNKTPSIRFKGFTDPWEQRKLGDVVKEITRNDPESEAPIMMITANNGFIEQSERYAFNNAGESLKKYILLKKGELAYNHGASKLRPYGSCFALTTAENARIPFVYHCFSAENQNAEFMSIELNGAEIENQLRKIVSSGARMDGLLNISFDEYTSVSVLLPGIEEQDRIADFFRQLDNLITLHQRKYNKLLNVKKSMLEKMFPKNGSNIPEIRFKGFTDPWEQRKVSEVSEIVAGGTPSTSVSEYWEPKEVPWLSSGEVHKKYITYTDDMISKNGLANSSAKIIKKNSVLIALAGQGKTRGTVAINRISLSTNQSIAAMSFNDDIVPEFVFSNLENRYDEIRAMSSGDGSRGGLNKQLVGDITIPYTIKEEQQKIGQYFSNLDHLITLHQRELEKLQNIKKSMLEKMFV